MLTATGTKQVAKRGFNAQMVRTLSTTLQILEEIRTSPDAEDGLTMNRYDLEQLQKEAIASGVRSSIITKVETISLPYKAPQTRQTRLAVSCFDDYMSTRIENRNTLRYHLKHSQSYEGSNRLLSNYHKNKRELIRSYQANLLECFDEESTEALMYYLKQVEKIWSSSLDEKKSPESIRRDMKRTASNISHVLLQPETNLSAFEINMSNPYGLLDPESEA